MTPNTAQTSTDLESKGSDGKDQSSAKKFKGTTETKAGESEKAASSSGNDGASQGAESGSDGSSDDNNTDHWEFAACERGSFNQMLADGLHLTSISNGSVFPVPD
uniref:Uncharacterized protein n=1 Tax=Rhizophora mucronata TaxID=61149 RepID=A0A2P2ILK9_RHIMU